MLQILPTSIMLSLNMATYTCSSAEVPRMVHGLIEDLQWKILLGLHFSTDNCSVAGCCGIRVQCAIDYP